MQFKYKEKIHSVASFDVNEKSMYYVTDRSVVYKYPNQELIKVESKFPGQILLYGNEKIVWQDGRGDSLMFDLDNRKVILSKGKDKLYHFVDVDLLDYNIIGVKVYVNNNSSYQFYHLEEDKFTDTDLNLSNLIKLDDMLFSVDRRANCIERVTIEGDVLWNYIINDDFKSFSGEKMKDGVANTIGIYENILWIALKSGLLMGLDVNDGKLIHEIKYNESIYSVIEFNLVGIDLIPFGSRVQMSKDDRIILGLRNFAYFEVNLKSKNPNRDYFNVKSSMKKYNLTSSYRNSNFPYINNNLIFCDDKEGRLGIFNRKTKSVIDSYDLEINKVGIVQILEMRKINSTIYVLDRHNDLHVIDLV